jgi:hypothetical protein
MANNRRMISNRIVKSSRFLMMPNEAQLLYFYMITEADDDGIVEAYPLMKLLGIPSDNLKVLLVKNFIRQINEDQIMVVTDWLEHNYIRADRKTDSIYLEEAKQAFPDMEFVESKRRSDIKGILDGQWTDIGRRKLSKDKLSKDNNICLFNEFWKEYPRKENKKKAQEIWTRKNLDKKYEEIISFISKAKQTDRWNKGITPHATTFLNQERWEDEIEGYGKIEKKPFYRGDPMVKVRDKWKVIINGEFYEFADSEDKIVWK